MTFPFRLEPLGDGHERSLFRCGEDALDRYFQTQVTQDIRRHIANCFVAVETVTSTIAAWYTISAASIPWSTFPRTKPGVCPVIQPCPLFGSDGWRLTRDFKVVAWALRFWPMPLR